MYDVAMGYRLPLAVAVAVVSSGLVACHRSHSLGEPVDAEPTDARATPCETTAPADWAPATRLLSSTHGYALAASSSCGVHVAASRGPEGELLYFVGDAHGSFSTRSIGISGELGLDAIALHGPKPYIAYHDGGLHVATGLEGTWSTELVDSEGIAGSIDVDASGTVHVVYTAGNSELRYARRDDTDTWSREPIDSRHSSGPTIAVTPDGEVHVSYQWLSAPSVHDVAHATNAAGSWDRTSLEPLDPLGELGSDSGVAVGPRGTHLVYQAFGGMGGARSVQHALRAAAGDFTFEAVDEVAPFGVGTNPMAVDAEGSVHLVYLGVDSAVGAPPLRYATNRSGTWTVETVHTAADGRAAAPLVAVDAAGVVHVLFLRDGGLHYTRRAMSR